MKMNGRKQIPSKKRNENPNFCFLDCYLYNINFSVAFSQYFGNDVQGIIWESLAHDFLPCGLQHWEVDERNNCCM